MRPPFLAVILVLITLLRAASAQNAPVITSLSFYTAQPGTQLTIFGSGFDSANTANNKVRFAEIAGQVVSATATSLIVRVPDCASAGPVAVAVGGRIATSARPFSPLQAKPEALDANSLGFALQLPNQHYAVVADLDGDGRPDLVDNSIGVLRNIGAAGSIEAATFAAPFGVGPQVSSVKVADLDGDGRPEIIGTVYAGAGAFYRNVSSPGLLAFTSLPSFTPQGFNTTESLVTDFDGDGRIDVVAIGFFGDVLLLHNTTPAGGAISFESLPLLASGSANVPAAVADIDGDGRPDLLFRVDGGQGSAVVDIFLNTSHDTTISAARAGRILAAGGGRFEVRDLDGDQRPDLIITASTYGAQPGSLVTIARNLSTAGQVLFDTPTVVNLANATIESFAPLAADVNGDGQPEIFAATVKGLSLIPVAPNGSGFTLGSPVALTQALNPNGNVAPSLLQADFDGDGRLDLAVTAGTETIFFRNTLAPVPAITAISADRGAMNATLIITGRNFSPQAAGNLVRFGAVQATISNASATSLTVAVPPAASAGLISVTVLASGLTAASPTPFIPTYASSRTITSSSFSTPVTFSSSGSVAVQAAADLDRDGKPDLVLADPTASKLVLLRNVGSSGSLSTASFVSAGEFPTAQPPQRLSIADLDGDGRLDLVVIGSGNVTVYRGLAASGPLDSAAFAAPASFAIATIQATDLVLADFDNDGLLDVALSDANRSRLVFLRNASTPGTLDLAAPQEMITGIATQALTAGDLDGDGRLDLVGTQNSLVLFRNDSRRGELRFTASGLIDGGGSGIFSVRLADLDGDRRPELIWTVQTAGRAYVARNLATPGTVDSTSFAPSFFLETATSGSALAIGDVDGDGAPEIVASSAGATAVASVFRNLGSNGAFTAASFAPRLEFATGLGLGGIALQDLDGDAKPELLVPNGSAGTLSILQNRTLVPDSAFFFGTPTFSATENGGSMSITVQRNFSTAATIKYTTSPGTAVAPGDFTSTAGTLTFAQGELSKTFIVPIADDNVFEPDESFFITLSNPSAGSVILEPTTARGVIIDNDAFGLTTSVTNIRVPDPVPPFRATLTVQLTPPEAQGQWRLLGEIPWRDRGAAVSNLLPGNYLVEYRPRAGYLTPDPTAVVITGNDTAQVQEFYEATTGAPTGSLTISIKPDDVATALLEANRGQWREQGSSTWLDGGQTLAGLPVGPHLIEFKPLAGRATPSLQSVAVTAGAAALSTGTYFNEDAAAGSPVAPVTDGNVQTVEPYVYMGQIQTDAGAGSGFVVLDRTVLTAAHVLFDDALLTFTPGVRWYLQRTPGSLEAPPLIPRGSYAFTGYAAQRTLDATPGTSTPASQNLDVATLYFEEPAARNGFGGFLRSDAQENEWLRSNRSKMLLGYPVEGGPPAVPGRLHASPAITDPLDFRYTRVYATTALRGFPGCSGGPLCVLLDNGRFYPAAIYLGGTAQTLVRAIDTGVVDLINRAQDSGNSGANNTGGGATLTNTNLGSTGNTTASIVFNLSPAAAANGDARWYLSTEPTIQRRSGQAKRGLPPGSYTIKFADVPGFNTPADRIVSVIARNVAPFSATYSAQAKPILTGPAIAKATAGVQFTYQILTSNGADTYSATGLPRGLALNAGGLVSGKAEVAGVYAVTVRARNEAGETAAPLQIIVSAPGELVVTLAGAGTLNAGFLGVTPRVQGKKYTVVAKPAAGYVFAGYSGDLTNAGPSFTFTMPQRLELVANFVPSPFLAVAGSYAGLITRPGSAGSVTFTVSGTGAFTLNTKLNGKASVFRSVLALDGSFTGATGTGAATASVQMQLDLTGATGLTGTFTTGGQSYVLQALQRGFDPRNNPATALAGKYTIALEPVSTLATVPQGIGFGTATVDAAGLVKFTGTLADGAKVSQSVSLSKDGVWPLFLAPAGNQASVAGFVTISEVPGANDLGGVLAWNKAATATGAPYTAAFTTDLLLSGNRYAKPANGEALLAFTDGAALLRTGTFEQAFTLPAATSAPTIRITGANSLSLTFTLSTGLFTGSYLPTPGVKAIPLNGAVLRGATRARGFAKPPAGTSAPLELTAVP